MFDKIFNTLVTRILNAVINLAIAVLVSNYLGASGKGEQGLIVATMSIIIIFTGIIGPASLVYHLPKFANGILLLSSYVWLVVSSILTFIFLFYSNIIAEQFIFDVFALTVILSITSINQSILISKEKIKEYNRINNIQTIVSFLVLIAYFIFKPSPSINHYLISIYSGYSIGLVVSFIYTRKSYSNLNFKNINNWKSPVYSMLYMGVFNQLAIFTQMLSFRLSYYLLSKYSGISSVGVYSNAVSIAESIWLISRSIALVQGSVIVNSKDDAYSIKLTKILMWVNISISAICLIPLIFIPAKFYTFVFGNDFGAMIDVIRLLAPGILFFGIVLIVSHYLSATGRHYYNTIASTIGLLFSLLFCYLLIPKWSILGAGLASSISYLVTAGVTLFFFIKVSKLSLKTFFPSSKDFILLLRVMKEKIGAKKAN